VLQFYMAKLLRSAGRNDAATELNFLNKKVLVLFRSVSLCAAVLCVAVKELLCNDLGSLKFCCLNEILSEFIIAKYLPCKDRM